MSRRSFDGLVLNLIMMRVTLRCCLTLNLEGRAPGVYMVNDYEGLYRHKFIQELGPLI